MKLVGLALVLAVATLAVDQPVEAQTTQQPQTAKNASYWITTSNKIHPGYPIQLSVMIYPGNEPVVVTLTITYEAYDMSVPAKTLLVSNPTEVAPGATRIIEVQVPADIKVKDDDYYGMYKVNVVGQGRTLNFSHAGDLTLIEKSFSIFIAIDKAIYKPGETVNFRVLAMDPTTLKVVRQAMDILFTDSKGNRIKQMIGVNGTQTLGVVQDKLELASSTPLGDWQIAVTVLGQTETKVFTVDNYVLPKFEVQVKVPTIPLESDQVHTITVSAKYTFGQPVLNGYANVRVTLYQFWVTTNPKSELTLNGKLNSNGEFVFEVNKKQLLSLVISEYWWATNLIGWSFNIQANVTEDATKKVHTGSAIMEINQSPMRAEFLAISPRSFKPGLAYTGYVEVKKADGSQFPPEVINKIKAYINVTYNVLKPNVTAPGTNSSSDGSADKTVANGDYYYWPSIRPSETKILAIDNPIQVVPESGFLVISFNVPVEAMSADITVKFDKPFESASAFYYLSKFINSAGAGLQLTAPTKQPKVGETIPLKVVATEPVKQLTCQVYSKGILVWNSTVSSPTAEGSKSIEFTLPICQAMAPSINIVVFYIRRENSELVADALSLSVDGLFQKPVSLTFSEEKVEPGQTFDAVITAEPDSLVFVVARDKSSELAKNGSDVTQEMVREGLASFDTGYYNSGMNFMFRCGWPWSFGGTDVSQLLQSANVLFFTNGFMVKPSYENYHPMQLEDKAHGKGSPVLTGGLLPANRVRTKFIETWIWNLFPVPPDSNGVIRVPVTSPDTITTWVARYFSVHPVYGLSVGSGSAEVTTFRDLFVSLDLPASIVRNEVFCCASSVFNYYPETIPVLLRFENSDDFKGMFVNRSGEEAVMSFENKARTDFYPEVAQNDVKTSYFCFTPIKTGEITLKVSALTNIPGLSDAVEQVITVKPEGVARSNNYPWLVNLTTGFWQQQLSITFPANTVNDSQSILVSFAGNVVGSIFKNIKDFLKKPYGCGEQNMINFAPSISVLEFFYSTNTIVEDVRKQANSYINEGYQTELTYEHKSGGFSAFGDTDGNASTWLTAFVLNTLCKAAIADRKYNMNLGLDMTAVINRSANYIRSQQNADGSFSEPGVVFHVAMQGGSSQNEALTAYSLIALSDAAEVLKDNAPALAEIQKSMSRAGDFLASRMNNIVEPYSICIVAYALNKVNHASKDLFFNKMEQKAITGDGLKYWQQTPPPNSQYQWSAAESSENIESTAYALLTYTSRGIDITVGLPILRYLTQKFGPNGGFTSTQDTVIGIQALSGVLAKLYSAGDYSIIFTISYLDDQQHTREKTVRMNKDTEFLLQTIDIPYKNNAPNHLWLTANTATGAVGPSTILVDTVLAYNVKGKTTSECLSMSHVLTPIKGGLELTVSVKSLSPNATSMSILSVEIPAGYQPDVDAVTESKYVSRVDPYNGDTLYIYFNSYVIDINGISVSIIMYAANGVLVEAQPKSYSVYDYYNPDCSQTQTYALSAQPVCEVVPGDGICMYLKK